MDSEKEQKKEDHAVVFKIVINNHDTTFDECFCGRCEAFLYNDEVFCPDCGAENIE